MNHLYPSVIILFCILLFSCNPATEEVSQEEKNTAFASLYFSQVYNKDNIELIDDLFVEDYEHTSTDGRVRTGRDFLKKAVKSFKGMMPHLQLTILESVAEGEKVMFLVNMSSHMPEMAQPKVKDNELSINEVFIFWVKEGKIYKGRTQGDHMGLIRQITGFEGGLFEAAEVLAKAAQADSSGS